MVAPAPGRCVVSRSRRRRRPVWWLAFALGILVAIYGVSALPRDTQTSGTLLLLGIVLMIGALLWRSGARSPLRGLPVGDPRMAHLRELDDTVEKSRARNRERIGPETEEEKYGDAIDGAIALGSAVVKDIQAEREEKRRLQWEARKKARRPDGN